MFCCGIIEYINALPFVAPFLLGFLKTEMVFIRHVPAALNKMVEEKKIPISMVSSIYYLKNKKTLQLISGLGIGAEAKMSSVSLFYPEGLHSFDKSVIVLDPESSTSNAILKWLLIRCKGAHPEFTFQKTLIGKPSSFLLIGDKCLCKGQPEGYKVMNLAEEWVRYTHLPLPFSLIVAEKQWAETHQGEIHLLKQDLLKGLSWSFKHPIELARLASTVSDLREDIMVPYWESLAYVFDERYNLALDFMEQHVLPL